MSSVIFSIKGQGLKLNSAEDIKPHLDALVALGPDVEEVHFGGNTLGVEACQALADVLKGLKKLKVARLDDIFTGRLISEIPAALTALCSSLSETTSLETLDLSDNAFGGRCAEPMVPFLSANISFSHFILNNNGLGPTGGLIIAEALLKSANASKAKGVPSNLRTFVCGRNRLENGSSELMSEALAAHGHLTTVRLPQNGIRMEGITALASGLSKNATLEVLDLQDNTLAQAGSLAVARALPSWPALRELNLSDCLLGRKGGISVAHALAKGANPALEVIKIQYGELDKRSFAILATAIRDHLPKLATLELNGNIVDAEDESVEKIKEALAGHGHEDALDELDEMEEDEGEEDEDDDEEAASEKDAEEDEDKKEEKAAAPKEAPKEDKPFLDLSVSDMSAALEKLSVGSESKA